MAWLCFLLFAEQAGKPDEGVHFLQDTALVTGMHASRDGKPESQ
jgi:hypothetical protein